MLGGLVGVLLLALAGLALGHQHHNWPYVGKSGRLLSELAVGLLIDTVSGDTGEAVASGWLPAAIRTVDGSEKRRDSLEDTLRWAPSIASLPLRFAVEDIL
ncbi:hypothetical protein [Streptomyces silvisoli]|uniref:Uncharacterized protein n=1 Tax=Streptomyces silvisoli TaxID=3034235 RepID=A0ABT5ZU87_9ACTN|nr:hypothetical protein [Streptomyces silvisoli]MDF3293388.1 hypothetical protein [Streptomyces silvisoli]